MSLRSNLLGSVVKPEKVLALPLQPICYSLSPGGSRLSPPPERLRYENLIFPT
jgi:hypothetical protein